MCYNHWCVISEIMPCWLSTLFICQTVSFHSLPIYILSFVRSCFHSIQRKVNIMSVLSIYDLVGTWMNSASIVVQLGQGYLRPDTSSCLSTNPQPYTQLTEKRGGRPFVVMSAPPSRHFAEKRYHKQRRYYGHTHCQDSPNMLHWVPLSNGR